MQRIGTPDGNFHAGDPSTGALGTIVTQEYMQALQEEIAGFIEGAGVELDPADNGQLAKAFVARLVGNVPLIHSINALPETNVGPILVAETGEVWLWSASAYFTGYRHPLCGRPVDGHTAAPLMSEVDAVGGTLSKTAYAGLWGYANENSLVVVSASWVAGTHNFVDLGGDNFRIPDLRNMFRRYTGTDADTANARNMGSSQVDTFQGHRIGNIQTASGGSTPVNLITSTTANQGGSTLTNGLAGVYAQITADTTHGLPRTGNETRPTNVAFRPRIHV